MKTIQKIDVKRELFGQKKKVAAYARVSKDTDKLQHSLSAQVSYYSRTIQSNPEWEFKGVYSDYGITGTSMDKRPGFLQMIEECKKGNIDIILTKSIKRFARNTVDLLSVVRNLMSMGIEVRFENEKIHSLSGEGELMLSILASFAQEESRSLSDNIKWALRKRYAKGLLSKQQEAYGYRWNGKNLVINKEEALVVRRMFTEYLNGYSRRRIAKGLNHDGIRTGQGNQWADYNVKAILKNISYTGNIVLQQYFTIDPISKIKKLNKGELSKYYIENNHEPIISKEMFENTQKEMQRRKEGGAFANPAIHTSELTSRICCPYCGKSFRRCTRSQKNRSRNYWACTTRKSGEGNPCHTGDLNDVIIKSQLCEVLGIEEYDPQVVDERLDHVDVIKKEKCVFYLVDGTVVEKKYRQLLQTK